MIKVPDGLWRKFDARVEDTGVPQGERSYFRKGLRYYLDFCHRYGHAYAARESLPLFLRKLASKGQNGVQRAQAAEAVEMYTSRG